MCLHCEFICAFLTSIETSVLLSVGAESHSGQIFCCLGALAIGNALHHVDAGVGRSISISLPFSRFSFACWILAVSISYNLCLAGFCLSLAGRAWRCNNLCISVLLVSVYIWLLCLVCVRGHLHVSLSRCVGVGVVVSRASIAHRWTERYMMSVFVAVCVDVCVHGCNFLRMYESNGCMYVMVACVYGLGRPEKKQDVCYSWYHHPAHHLYHSSLLHILQALDAIIIVRMHLLMCINKSSLALDCVLLWIEIRVTLFMLCPGGCCHPCPCSTKSPGSVSTQNTTCTNILVAILIRHESRQLQQT